MSAVKEAEPMRIRGKVRRNPVENHADAVLMQNVDQIHQVLRRAVAAGRGKVSCDLISPGTVKRMLHDPHELDMREDHLLDIFGQLGSDLSITQRTISLFGHAHPRSYKHRINGDPNGAALTKA